MDFKYVSQLSAYPGEQFQLGVQAFDELGRPTATIFRLSEMGVSAEDQSNIILIYIASPNLLQDAHTA